MPTDPTGKVVRNIFALRQYENGLSREVVQQFERSAERLKRILLRLDPTSVSAGRVRRRLKRLYKAADEAIKQLYSQVNDITVEGLLGVAQVESEFAAGVLDSATGAAVDIETQRIGRSFARSIVQTDPIQGQVMRDWWKQQKAKTRFGFRTQVQLGLAQNETIDQIVRRVRGRSVGGGRYVGGVMQTSTREATALVRTAVNEVATRASYETYAANDDITKKYEWVSTFDSRTSDICISLDGKTWAYDDPNRKMPPAHWNCRSTIAPIVDWEGLGIEPPKPGMRASADGPISASSRYGDWLKNQSVAEQNKILGRGRAQLWRDGKLDLKDLVRSDGRSVTLGELERKLGLPKGWQGGGPGWKPSMTLAEAREWAQDSAIKYDLYHATDAAEAITNGGFRLDVPVVNGRVLGDGVYLGVDASHLARWEGNTTLRVMANVKNVATHEAVSSGAVLPDVFRGVARGTTNGWTWAQELADRFYPDLAVYYETQGIRTNLKHNPAGLAQILMDMGLDAVTPGAGDMVTGVVVFDPKKLVVISG